MTHSSGLIRCAVYTRVSTDNQAEVEFNSCEAQKEKIASFINSQENMKIYKVYSDAGYTGGDLDRPALQAMLDDIRKCTSSNQMGQFKPVF